MKIAEALRQKSKLQQLIGTKIPGNNRTIDEIMPVRNDERLVGFLADYYYIHVMRNL